MKKISSFVILALLLALVGVSVYLYASRSKMSTISGDGRDFAHRDTASITRIFIADKEGNASTLTRTKKGWVVNDKYACRSDAILNLLEVIKLVEVKMPVPKDSRENVIKFMSFNAIKVEIYEGDDLVKQYYVGHETPDAEGSFMLLTNVETGKNYKDPYACFIPGFKGFLAPRFIARENEWRDRLVMNFIPPQMKQVKIEHPGAAADSSLTVDLLNANTFSVKTLSGKSIDFNEEKLRQYLVYFQNVSYEVLLTGKNTKLQDSLATAGYFTRITVTTTDGKAHEYRFYRKPFLNDRVADSGIKYPFDPDRLYMSFNAGREWALIQYFVFGKLLVNSEYFSQPTPPSVKK